MTDETPTENADVSSTDYHGPLFARDPPEMVAESDVLTPISCGPDGYGVAIWDHAEGPAVIEYDNLGSITDMVIVPPSVEATEAISTGLTAIAAEREQETEDITNE